VIASRQRDTVQVVLPGLRTQRQTVALTQEQLADKAGVSRPTVTRLENGARARITTVRKLADALGCEPRELMESDSWQT
jgi:transcriptional regulator with XRE-family HTH domain